MADNVIKTNQTQTWQVNDSNETWLVTKDATFNVINQYAILESGSGNTITVLGDINVSGNVSGIRFQGSTSDVVIGAKSVINAINAESGIHYEGAGGHISVSGTIKGGDNAIHGNVWAVVENRGKLSGDDGIVFDDAGSDITNFRSIDVTGTAIETGAESSLVVNEINGVIHSGDKGVVFTGMGESVLSNKGLIQADDVAIESGDDRLTATNTGNIIGDVMLGGGSDRFDTRRGALDGTIHGGEGDDEFLISKSSVKIVEMAGGGEDAVYSTAGYTLSNGVERLLLRGGKDIDGNGSALANDLFGNSGDNALSGRNGNDNLDGGLGGDILSGDLGKDVFIFNSGYGKDRVTDFKDGVDHIRSDMVQTQQQFDNLDIKQAGDNVVIDFGAGEKLILEHFTMAKLDFNDFVI
ncbi:MAG: hemolysin-type calcium-binding repeat family protein [Rhizobium sp.]|nr:hemolysin-type calcium-binding repeat family protein [Rhizobium sp.]